MYIVNPQKRNSDKLIKIIEDAVKKYEISYLVCSCHEIDFLKRISKIDIEKKYIKPNDFKFKECFKKSLDKLDFDYDFNTILKNEDKIYSKSLSQIPRTAFLHSLKLLSKGERRCVNASANALEKGLIPSQKKVIAISETNKIIDTAIVIKPQTMKNILKTKIIEVLFKHY